MRANESSVLVRVNLCASRFKRYCFDHYCFKMRHTLAKLRCSFWVWLFVNFFSYSIILEVIPGLIKFQGKKDILASALMFFMCACGVL